MANEEHLQILKSGVKNWNTWRSEHPGIKPHLRGANLQGANLQGANLQGANFLEMVSPPSWDLTVLEPTDLRGANLWEANLWEANLRGADLRGADLQGANLQRANLQDADLQDADLQRTILKRANLQDAGLRGADLLRANLQGANLQGANLLRANLQGANLQEINLQGFNLQKFNLQGVDFRRANLQEVDLRVSNLADANFSRADLTGVKLWRAQTHDWSLVGVTCEYVSWDKEGEDLTYYAPGEFEKAYGAKTEIIVEFPGGMGPVEWALLPIKLEELQKQHPDSQINLRSIVDDGSGAKLTITVDDLAGRDREEFRSEVALLQKELNEYRQALVQSTQTVQTLQAGYNRLKDATCELVMEQHELKQAQMSPTVSVDDPTGNRAPNQPSILNFGGNVQVGNSGDTFINQGQAAIVGPDGHAHDNTFNQIWDQSKDSIDLTALAADLTKLREAMQGDITNGEQAMAIGAVAEAEQAAQQGDGPKALEALKKGSAWALDKAEKIGLAVATAAIKAGIGL